VDEDKLSGRYQVSWDGKNEEGNDVSSGIYFYVIKTKDFTQTKKMTLVR
jgi:flagellar hook assembly protein FlgD